MKRQTRSQAVVSGNTTPVYSGDRGGYPRNSDMLMKFSEGTGVPKNVVDGTDFVSALGTQEWDTGDKSLVFATTSLLSGNIPSVGANDDLIFITVFKLSNTVTSRVTLGGTGLNSIQYYPGTGEVIYRNTNSAEVAVGTFSKTLAIDDIIAFYLHLDNSTGAVSAGQVVQDGTKTEHLTGATTSVNTAINISGALDARKLSMYSFFYDKMAEPGFSLEAAKEAAAYHLVQHVSAEATEDPEKRTVSHRIA